MMSISIDKFKLLLSHSFLRFASVGVINSLLSLAIIFSLKSIFGFSDIYANFIGYVAGLVSSFILNKRWTFKNTKQVLPTLLRFCLVFIFSYCLNILAVLTAIRLGVNDYFSHIVGMPIYSITFYFGCRYLAFSNKPSNNTSLNKSKTSAIGMQNLSNSLNESSTSLKSDYIWFVSSMLFVLIVLFFKLNAIPIEVWDEARLAVNGLEMSKNGLSLVTTYEGIPDHWNTKPPLLIWLMSITISLFGMNEWGVRIPSVISALLTAAVVYTFCCYYLKKPLVGFLAVVLLFTTVGYIHFHSARSGDYDALLTLWTTSYLFAGYLYFETNDRYSYLWLFICTVCLILSFLTKSIQGFIFIPALIAYGLWQKKLIEIKRSPAIFISILSVLGVCVYYYWAREQVDPGYFSAVKSNDLMGRYAVAIEQDTQKPYFYFIQKEFPWVLIGIIVVIIQCIKGKDCQKKISAYFALITLFYVVTISAAATKHPWYLVPICPFISIIMATAVYQCFEFASKKLNLSNKLLLFASPVFAILAVFINAYMLRFHEARLKEDILDQYNYFLRSKAISEHSPSKFLVIHPGYINNAQPNIPYFAPPLFYVNALRETGKIIVLQSPAMDIPSDFNTVIFCGEKIKKSLESKFILEVVTAAGGCGLFTLKQKTI